jgi:hypothetical protein
MGSQKFSDQSFYAFLTLPPLYSLYLKIAA